MRTQLTRPSPPALCVLIAGVGGLLGGTTTVHDLRQNQYGPVNPPVLVQNGGGDEGIHIDGGYGETNSANCYGCSQRDLGYRWATLAQVTSSEQCPNDSWGFRRGCLDYTGGV